MFADEWKSHEDTVELSSLLSAGADEMKPCQVENESGSTSSSGDEQSDDDDDDDAAAAADDDDENKDSFTALSSRNPFELLDDHN